MLYRIKLHLVGKALSLGRMFSRCRLLSTMRMIASSSVIFRTMTGMVSLACDFGCPQSSVACDHFIATARVGSYDCRSENTELHNAVYGILHELIVQNLERVSFKRMAL